jgi:hypothetical protein
MIRRFISISIAGIFLLIACCCTSCKEKPVNEELHILIQNRTDSLIHITLYPKAEYRSGNLYRPSEKGGGYKSPEFSLSPHDDRNWYDWSEVIFVTDDLNIEPYILAVKVFDSIYISSINKDSIIIKFTHENVTGYTENIFSKNSIWNFKIVEDNQHTQFSPNPQKYYCYSFLISEDKIIIE